MLDRIGHFLSHIRQRGIADDVEDDVVGVLFELDTLATILDLLVDVRDVKDEQDGAEDTALNNTAFNFLPF